MLIELDHSMEVEILFGRWTTGSTKKEGKIVFNTSSTIIQLMLWQYDGNGIRIWTDFGAHGTKLWRSVADTNIPINHDSNNKLINVKNESEIENAGTVWLNLALAYRSETGAAIRSSLFSITLRCAARKCKCWIFWLKAFHIRRSTVTATTSSYSAHNLLSAYPNCVPFRTRFTENYLDMLAISLWKWRKPPSGRNDASCIQEFRSRV